MSENNDAPKGTNQAAWQIGWSYCFGYEAGATASGGEYPCEGTRAALFADYREQKVIERGEGNLFTLLREDLAAFEASL